MPATVQAQTSAQPALRQWVPCIAMLLLSLLSYIDRNTLAILSPTILSDLHLTATQYGYAVTAFSVAYMISNPVWGFLIDHRGLFWTILAAVVLWSLASGSHALMLGLTGMCVARALLGFGEGATFPAGLSTVAETLPPERRSFALGLAYSGGSLGAALTPLLITPIATRHGWRDTFLLTGLLGILWVVLWTVMRSTGLYKPHTPQLAARPAAPLRFAERLNAPLFGSVLLYGFGAAPLAFGLYAVPLYLNRVLHVSQISLGHLLWIPPIGWECGYLFWGTIADRRSARGAGRPTAIFTVFAAAGFVIVLLPLVQHTPHPVLATMALFFLEMFIAGGYVVLSLADGAINQKHGNAGFLAGIAISAWALVTAVLMPVVGKLFDRGQYTGSLWLVACLPPIGTLLWKALSSTPRSAGQEMEKNPLN